VYSVLVTPKDMPQLVAHEIKSGVEPGIAVAGDDNEDDSSTTTARAIQCPFSVLSNNLSVQAQHASTSCCPSPRFRRLYPSRLSSFISYANQPTHPPIHPAPSVHPFGATSAASAFCPDENQSQKLSCSRSVRVDTSAFGRCRYMVRVDNEYVSRKDGEPREVVVGRLG
jgi:hypothetical protein